MWRNNSDVLNENPQGTSKEKTKEIHADVIPEGESNDTEDEPVFLALEQTENNFHDTSDGEIYAHKVKKPRTGNNCCFYSVSCDDHTLFDGFIT